MDMQIQAIMENVRKMAAADPQYRQMLLDMRVIENRYNTVLATLSAEDQNTICDFVSLCEEMSWRMLELVCATKESPSE